MIFETIAWFCFQANRPFADVFRSKQTAANLIDLAYISFTITSISSHFLDTFSHFSLQCLESCQLHPGCMWRSTCLGDNSLLVDSRRWFSVFIRSFRWSSAAGNESTDDLERSLVDAGVLKWSGDGTYFLRHFSQWMLYLGYWWKQSKAIKYTIWMIGYRIESCHSTVDRPQGKPTWRHSESGPKHLGIQNPNACCLTIKFLNTAPWCFIWDPGSIFAGVWS